MTTTKIIWLVIGVFLVAMSLAVVTDEGLSWGTFLGANWKVGEGEENWRQTTACRRRRLFDSPSFHLDHSCYLLSLAYHILLPFS